jgi:hypothetical protein
LRGTTTNRGTDRFARFMNIRQTRRTSADVSACKSTMKTGLSQSEISGRRCASQSCTNRAALSVASASIAPVGCIGSMGDGQQ